MAIDIEQTQVEDNKPHAAPASVDQPQDSADNEPKELNYDENLDQELQVKLQPILLDAAISALGNTLSKITSIDGMAFSDDEKQALIDAWTPLLPNVSPMTNAILVTVIILSGKGMLYYAHKRANKLALPSGNKALPVDSQIIKEAVN